MLDIAGFGSHIRTTQNLMAMRTGLRRSIERACADAGIPLGECDVQDMGDGLNILAPEKVARGAFAGVFLTRLDEELRQHNASHPPGEQIRLRLALNTGEITRDENGTVGHGLIHTKRLLDSARLRKSLKESSGPLAVIVSSSFYRDVVRERAEYEPGAYLEVSLKSKETRDFAWIRSPDHSHASTEPGA